MRGKQKKAPDAKQNQARQVKQGKGSTRSKQAADEEKSQSNANDEAKGQATPNQRGLEYVLSIAK